MAITIKKKFKTKKINLYKKKKNISKKNKFSLNNIKGGGPKYKPLNTQPKKLERFKSFVKKIFSKTPPPTPPRQKTTQISLQGQNNLGRVDKNGYEIPSKQLGVDNSGYEIPVSYQTKSGVHKNRYQNPVPVKSKNSAFLGFKQSQNPETYLNVSKIKKSETYLNVSKRQNPDHTKSNNDVFAAEIQAKMEHYQREKFLQTNEGKKQQEIWNQQDNSLYSNLP